MTQTSMHLTQHTCPTSESYASVNPEDPKQLQKGKINPDIGAASKL